MADKITVKVPATTANIGPGFDIIGMALNLYNEFIFTNSEDIQKNNLIIESFIKTFEYFNKEPVKKTVEVKSDVPMSRGLGSSATCIVAGVVAAFLEMGLEIDKREILKIATKIEGHPDNVAPAIYGGLIASLMEDDKIYCIEYDICEDLNFYTMIPDFELSTEKARKILPEKISLSDGIFNTARLSFILKGLEIADEELIKLGVKDKFHQIYRKELVKGSEEVFEFVRENNASPYISGAGPTLIAIKKSDESFEKALRDFLNKNYPKWELKTLQVNKEGVKWWVK